MGPRAQSRKGGTMHVWQNTSVIPCVDRSGGPVSVIEQCRAARAETTLRSDGQDGVAQRFVLGNGLEVLPLDHNRFVMPDTREVVTRR